jgi:hypothetical protein
MVRPDEVLGFVRLVFERLGKHMYVWVSVWIDLNRFG